MDVVKILTELRAQGNDTDSVEVKSAHGGYPENTAQTMSAFANTPGGGILIFGVDEHQGFQAVGVYDAVKCQQAAANTARQALQPPITVTTEVTSIDGHDIVVAYVPEVDRSVKPVQLVKTGQSYVRMYDGDYRLSEVEEQIFIAGRGHPRDDEQPVADATLDDLGVRSVESYVHLRRSSSQVFVGMDDHEVLVRTGVLSNDGKHPTLAGLLALGVYPQQFFPSLAIQASLRLETGSQRAADVRNITGSIPRMLEDCADWVRQITPTAIEAVDRAGTVIDRPTYPPIAVREIVANALIHRDLSPATVNIPATVTIIRDSRMIVSNPGGLFGVSIDGLGKSPSSPRNARLVEILQYVRDTQNNRVVERLGSGIPAAQSALAAAELPPAAFDDRGVRFTVVLESSGFHRGNWAGVNLATQAVLEAVGPQGATIAQLTQRTGKTSAQVRYMVAKLVDAGDLTRQPLDGKTQLYRRTDPHARQPLAD